MTADYIDNALPVVSEAHRQKLEQESDIRPEVIAARGYFTAQHPHQLQFFGFSREHARHLIPCLVLPLFSPDGTQAFQVRPDTPKEGGAKYLLPKGGRLILDMNPLGKADMKNPSVELWVTEGTRKADSAVSHGLCCLALMGVYGWRDKNGPLADWEHIPLKGRSVVLAFDSDVMSKFQVWCALRRLIAFLRGRGAVVSIAYLPPGPEDAKTGLDDFFARGGTVAQLRELIEPELRPLRAGKAIETNSRQLRDKTHDALTALVEHNEPPVVFQRSGTLARVHVDEQAQAAIQPMTVAILRNRLACVTDWISTSERRGVVEVGPPVDVCENLLALPAWSEIPPLLGIVAAPTFAANGALHHLPGYDEATRLYLHTAQPLDLGDTAPTPENVQRAKHLLLVELMGDFAFAEAASRAHALAYLLLPFVRALIDGPTPLHLFEAPVSGSGKSLLCEVLSAVFAGSVILTPPPKQPEEMEKLLVSVLLSGASHLVLDNARRLDGEALLGALTATTYSGRVLGGNQMARLPVRLTWAATANNLQTGEELVRRTVPIRIDTGREHPEERANFRHPDLLGWARENRAALIGACVTLVKHWLALGRPAYRGGLHLGSYEAYTAVMGGIVEACGLSDFLQNRQALRERADNDGTAWSAFAADWWEQHGEQEVTAAKLYPLALERFADRLGDGSERSQKTRLGRMLGQHLDRIFNGRKIVNAGRGTSGENKNLTQFRLQPLPDPVDVGDVGDVSLLPTGEYSERRAIEIQQGSEATHVSHVSLPLTLTITPTLRATAQALANERTKAHDQSRRPDEDRGAKGNRSGDLFGVLAEVTLTDALERDGRKPEGYVLLADRPPTRRGDFTLNGLDFDVKACPPGNPYANVNLKAHHDERKRPDHYLFALFADESRFTLACVPASDVDAWPTAEGHSHYYRMERAKLKPLCRFEELPVGADAAQDDEEGWR
jgi:hypothetical protein